MKENKEFSLLEMEAQTAQDNLVLIDDQPTGELVIDRFPETDGKQQPPALLDDLAQSVKHEAKPAPSQMDDNEARADDEMAEVEQTLLSISHTLDQLMNASDDYVQQRQWPNKGEDKRRDERKAKDTLVPDLYAQKEWHPVINSKGRDYDDSDRRGYYDSVLPSPSKKRKDKPVVAPAPAPKQKSLGRLGTALLAGGGVLVLGLATAGVISAIKSHRTNSQSTASMWDEAETSVAEPVDPPKPPASKPPVTNHRPRPIYHRPPVRPLFGFAGPNHCRVG